LANESLSLNLALSEELLPDDPVIKFAGSESRPSNETQTALICADLANNLNSVKVVRKVTLTHKDFEPYRFSRKNGIVEFPDQVPNKLGHWSVGYIHEIIQTSQKDTGLVSLLACVAECIKSEEKFLGDREDLGVRLCGRGILRYVLTPVEKMAHVVRYPWSTSAQLFISIHNHSASA
jgi:hypothetical protein